MLEREKNLSEIYHQMFIVAYAKMRNEADALDIVQESWVKILDKLDTLKDEDKLIQWAKAITANTALNVLKKRSGREVYYPDEALFIEGLREDRFEHRFMLKEVWDSLKILDTVTRTAFILKFYYDYKDKDIAEKMKLPVGTVKARLHRGKERLRKKLESSYLEFS